MTVDSNLASDYAALVQRINAKLTAYPTAADVADIMKNELVPFMGNFVEEIGEIDGAVSDLIHEADDILQPETAAAFGELIMGTRELIEFMKPRVDKAAHPKVWQGLSHMTEVCNRCEGIITEITVLHEDDDEDDGEEEEEEEEEEDGDDDVDTDEKKKGSQ